MNSVLSAPVFPAVINTEFLSWCCVRSPPRKQSRGLFLVSWPWSWTSALFTCWLQTKMVLTERRKFGVREEQETVNQRRAEGSRDLTSSSSPRGSQCWCSVGKCQILLLSPVSPSLCMLPESLDLWIFSELCTFVSASKLAGKTSLNPEVITHSILPAHQKNTHEPGLTLTFDLFVNNRALMRWSRALQRCFYLRWCQNERDNLLTQPLLGSQQTIISWSLETEKVLNKASLTDHFKCNS